MNVLIDGVRYVPAQEPCADPTLLDFVHDFMDVGKVSIREYLCALLTQLWEEGEGFSGKYPFGNSGWEYGLYDALVLAGAVPGETSMDGDEVVVEQCTDKPAANAIIFTLITEMCKAK